MQLRRGICIAGLPRHTLKLPADWKVSLTFTLGADAHAVSNMVTQGNEGGLREDPESGDTPARADARIRGHALLNLRAGWTAEAGWEVYARVTNALDRRYETFSAIAADLFPNGLQLQPHQGAVDAALDRFVAPRAQSLPACATASERQPRGEAARPLQNWYCALTPVSQLRPGAAS